WGQRSAVEGVPRRPAEISERPALGIRRSRPLICRALMVFARGQPVCGHERRDSMRRLQLIILGIGLLGARMAVACEADAGPDITAVPGMPVLLAGSGSGTGDLQYTWFPTEGLSDPHAAQPLLLAPATTTTYTLSVTDANGCSTNSHVTVTVVPWPAALLVAAGAEVTTTEVD